MYTVDSKKVLPSGLSGKSVKRKVRGVHGARGGLGVFMGNRTAEAAQDARPLARLLMLVLVLVLVFSCLACFGPGRQMAFAAPGDATIQIKQEFSASGTATPPSTTFHYYLTPQAASNPMPAGGGSISIAANGTVNIALNFTRTGIYTYTLSHVTPLSSGYTFDNQVYTIDIYVMNDLSTAVIVYDQNQFKVGGIAYSHSFYANVPPPPPPPPVIPPPVIPPPVIYEPVTIVTQGPPITIIEREVPTIEILPPETPRDPGSWALVNLILAIIGILLGIVTAIRALRKNDKKEDDEDAETVPLDDRFALEAAYPNLRDAGEYEEDPEEKFKKTRRVWLVVVLVLAVVGIVFFFLTENMRLPMKLVDIWTIVNALILALEIVAVALVFKKYKEETEEDEEEDEAMVSLEGGVA